MTVFNKSLALFLPLAVFAASAGAAEMAHARTRQDVRAEQVQAVRNGDLPSPDRSGLTLRERFPQLYPQADEQGRNDSSAPRSPAPSPLHDGRSGDAVER